MSFRRPTAGQIQIQGVNVADIPLHELRDKVAVIFQNTQILDGTVAENIVFGYKSEPDIMEIEQAAKAAAVHDFIMMLPDGYHTTIGSQAQTSLSGGQLQRICGIARALFRKPLILLADECTSALDPISENKIIESLEHIRDNQNVMIVSVTHHPSTAQNADSITVFDKGLVGERGTYTELIQNEKSIFYSLANAAHQTEDEEESEENGMVKQVLEVVVA